MVNVLVLLWDGELVANFYLICIFDKFNILQRDLKARKIARLLYEKATIYLNRKYQIYKQFCQLEEESSMKKSSKIGEGCDANTEVSSVITKGTETL